MNLEHGSKLLMIGDSITDCERTRPVGKNSGLGNGYVSIVDGMLRATYPQAGVRVFNMGIGGNTVLDLKQRWTEDALHLEPDYVTVMIGVNDVWRQFDEPSAKETHVDEVTYQQTLTELVARTKPSVKEMYLLSPFYLEPNRDDPMRKMVDRYGQLMRSVAQETGVQFVDVQRDFDNILATLYTYALSGDRVHPNVTGHYVIARAFLKHIGFKW